MFNILLRDDIHIACDIHIRRIGFNVRTRHCHVATGFNFHVVGGNFTVCIVSRVSGSVLFAATVVNGSPAADTCDINAYARRNSTAVLAGIIDVGGSGFGRVDLYIAACVDFNAAGIHINTVKDGVLIGVNCDVFGINVADVFCCRRGR